MQPYAKDVIPIRIEDELRSSYMDYSMSVIIGRALPDVRDGLKPVHRRILYAMHREGLHYNKKYSKCAGVVGEVLKKYHPHGDSAVYDALVRMAQPWNLRYLLVDGQGNFGSVDGDPAAAYRYTECRMTRMAEDLLVDIDKDTVDFTPNFDGATEEPVVLPAGFPNLLVNGADGIAVGMATKIPPHNLGEIIDAAVALIANPELDFEDLLDFVPGPDFPTGGTIYGRKGIRDAYATGRGRVVIRGLTRFEDLPNGRRAIIIDEIPYQVNKARLIEQVADLVKDKKLHGIHALRDESDRTGMRVVIELKHDAFEEVVLNHLFKSTSLQSTFGVILLAIVNQRPRILSLHDMLAHYISHRRDVVTRRTRFELAKALARAHVLEGYRIALDHIDEVIATIRGSATVNLARAALIARFQFTEVQANAILELRLQRLTGMERDKIEEEYAELQDRIAYFESLLASETLLMGVVRDELLIMRERYADERRTRIVEARGELTMHDLVAEEDQVVTLSHLGYIKRCSPDEWRTQARGGMGKRGMNTRAEDFVSALFIANTHSILLVFTHNGKVYPLNVYEVPEAGRAARGRPIVNLVPVEKGERIAAVVSVRQIVAEEPVSDENVSEGEDDQEAPVPIPAPDLLFVSKQGLIKRTPLSAYKNLRAGGMIAVGVADDDVLMVVRLVPSGDQCHVMLFSALGKCIRFPWADVPEFGRTARGNRGIRLSDGDEVVDMVVVMVDGDEPAEAQEVADESEESEETLDNLEEEGEAEQDDDEPWDTTLLTVSELGYGKRTPLDSYPHQGRYGLGVVSFKTSDNTGGVVGAQVVSKADQLMLVTDTGRVIRISAGSVRLVQNRATKGVRLMRLDSNERIVDLARLEENDEDETTSDGTGEE
jgi:DNA gyrase subunit A